jgi:hypothetical protein
MTDVTPPVRNPIQRDLGHTAADLLRNGFKLRHDREIASREGRQGRMIGALEHIKAAAPARSPGLYLSTFAGGVQR